MNTTNALIETEYRLGAHNYKPIDVVLSRGEGVYVWDLDGNRYLDCLSAYSAVNQGHCHPKILAAMIEQAQKLTLTSRAFRNDQLAHFYEELAALTGSHKILPMNSGAEAVETASRRCGAGATRSRALRARPRSSWLQQLPWPHHGDRRLLDRPGCPLRLRPVRARLQDRSVRRHRSLPCRDQRPTPSPS
jgi:hypothetical protein